MVLSLVIWSIAGLGFTFWQALGAGSLLLFVLALFAAATKRYGAALSVIVALWLVTGVASCLTGGIGSLVITHVLPFALVAVALWMWRAVAFVSGIPFLLPVALVVVFLPLLTQDLWTVGDDIKGQLFAVAVVALGPLLVVLGTRFSQVDVQLAFQEATAGLSDIGSRDQAAVEAVKHAPRADARMDPPSDD
jgi:hypothetical protein